MDIPPNIPTSFVPQSTVVTARRSRVDLTGIFGFFAYGILGIVFILAIGVFFYGRILSSTQASKEEQLAKARANIDPTTVAGFVQLRNRLNSGAMLLGNHIAVSNFFSVIGTVMPSTIRFTSLRLTRGDTKDPKKVKLDGTGTAKNFNALAAASTAFAKDGRVKEAIFSNIGINRDGPVTFSFTATLDPSLVTFSPSTAAPSAAAPSAPATASTSPTL